MYAKRRNAIIVLCALCILMLGARVWMGADAAQAQAGTGLLVAMGDITGAGATVPISSTAGAHADWCQFVAPSTNAAVVRWGDATVSASRGAVIAPGAGQMLPWRGKVYWLTSIYVYAGAGDKLTITCSD
mgnify:CR=1 FL=1